MHILFIPSWYPMTADDINGCFFREQAIALTRARHRVGVLCFYGHGQGRFSRLNLWFGSLQESEDMGVETWRVHHVSGIRGYGRIIMPIIARRYFKKYCKRHGKPDILHAQSALNGGLLAMQLSHVHGLPYIVTEHSSAFPRQSMAAKSLAKAKIVFHKATDVLTVSSSLANCIKNACKLSKNIKVVPNILNQNIFSDTIIQDQPPKDYFQFLNIGLLSQNKGQDILIKAFSKEFRDKPTQLFIGGYGEKYMVLKQLILDLGMTAQIHLLGKLSREEVHQHMMECNAFVLSSLFETFGVVLVEALACGKPVVTTACGGPEGIVTPENGILVEKGSIDALANGMKYMFDNIDQYESDKIRIDCINKFGEKAVVEKLTGIYKACLTN